MELSGVFPAASVVEVENISYLQTEKGTLVFTISPNGHVWGHRIEDGGKKNDVELEVYSLEPGGYAGHILKKLVRKVGVPSYTIQACSSDLTVEQDKAIRHILGQKESLTSMLGCFALNERLFHNVKSRYPNLGEIHSKLALKMAENFWVADCSFHEMNRHDRLGFFDIEYLDEKYVFELHGASYDKGGKRLIPAVTLKKSYNSASNSFGHAKPKDLDTLYHEGYKFFKGVYDTEHKSEFPHYIVSAVQAKDKKFFVGGFPACVERHLLPNAMAVLCDTENIFDCFEIDEAMLLLEEKRLSEEKSELYWTLAVAQNKIMKEQRRIKSNNPKA